MPSTPTPGSLSNLSRARQVGVRRLRSKGRNGDTPYDFLASAEAADQALRSPATIRRTLLPAVPCGSRVVLETREEGGVDAAASVAEVASLDALADEAVAFEHTLGRRIADAHDRLDAVEAVREQPVE
jgi:hypothetical protein